MKTYVISILVEDNPGVLTRVSGMFARRGFNIETLTVGKSQKKGISKIVISILAQDEEELTQIENQIHKLVDTLDVKQIDKSPSIIRELSLIKLSAKDKESKEKIFEIANTYNAKVIDITPKSVILEMMATPQKIDSLMQMFSDFKILDISRTGVTAIIKGNGDSALESD